ncbi:MAG: hypothetical protein ACK4SZ_06375 [Allosphingosinicella sp.]|uniref:hypothetical protein n=1 Tax=Allosphingosinicella sp. TaxID=2823234 RepID=UPI003955FBB3
MSWSPRKRRLVQFAVLAIAAGEISAAAAEVLILRSAGPSARSYPAGRRVADNTNFTLRPSDVVVILTNGATRTFRGPGSFSAAGPVRGGPRMAGGTNVRRQTGAVRTDLPAAEEARPADIWQFDVTQSGRACVLPGQRPVLWRPQSDRAVRLTITPQNGAAQTVNWNAGQSTLEWPASVPVVDGASYQLNWTGAPNPVRVTTQTLTGVQVGNVEAVAIAFLDKNCRSQLDVLIATRAATDGPA